MELEKGTYRLLISRLALGGVLVLCRHNIGRVDVRVLAHKEVGVGGFLELKSKIYT